MRGAAMNGELPVEIAQAYPGDLANRLTELGYIGLFQQAGETYLQHIWNTPDAPEALEILAVSSNAPMLARFLAAEILFSLGDVRRVETHKQELAEVYVTALADNFTEAANPWGLPGVTVGLAGEHLLAIGEPMPSKLLNLLDDDKRVYYEGSQEATLGQRYGYRVKDLAAYFIGRVRNIPFELEEDPGRRDKEIEKLKRAMK
jgi:hypothetical protein